MTDHRQRSTMGDAQADQWKDRHVRVIAAVEADTVEIPIVPAATRPHPARRAFGLLLWVLVIGLVAVAAALTAVPAATGSQTLVVLSGSMEPTLPVGAAAVIRPRPVESIGVSDVITYTDRTSGAPRTVTHRVVAVEADAAGPRFVTRGDANEENDAGTVAAADVQGVLWYQVNGVGTLRDVLWSRIGLLLGGGVALLVLAGHLLLPRTAPAGRR